MIDVDELLYSHHTHALYLLFLSIVTIMNELNKTNTQNVTTHTTVGIIELVPSSTDSKNTTDPFEELISTKPNLSLLVEVTITKSRYGITNYVDASSRCWDISITSVLSNFTQIRQSFLGSCPRVTIKHCDYGISTNEPV